VDAVQAQGLKTQTGQSCQIGLEFAIGLRFKHRSNRSRSIIKGMQNVGANLESIRSNTRP
jgi:hypothetical protein